MDFISDTNTAVPLHLAPKGTAKSVLQPLKVGGFRGRRSRHQHRSTDEQRVVLGLLVEKFENSLREVTPVFNAFYRGALPRVHGLNQNTLSVQWSDIRTQRKKFDFQAALGDMVASPLVHVDSENTLLILLETKALAVGIQPVRKSVPLASKTPQLSLKRKRGNAERTVHKAGYESTSTSYSSEDAMDLLKIPNVSQLPSPTTPAAPTRGTTSTTARCSDLLMTPPSSKSRLRHSALPLRGSPSSPTKSRSNVSKTARYYTNTAMPLIGFRGFSKHSEGKNGPQAFIAGAFAQTARIPPCPDTDDAKYRREALLHVAWSKTSLSPFISLTTNPIRAIMVAGNLQKKCTGYLAMIDLHVLNDESTIKDAKFLSWNQM